MELDKTNGYWVDGNFESSDLYWKNYKKSLIDDYAYNFYIKNIISNVDKRHQQYFIYSYYVENKFKRFYIFAENMLRKEKIEKIKNKLKYGI